MFSESFDLREMRCYISQHNKINKIIVLKDEYNRSRNGHIIYFTNNYKKEMLLSDEFIMLEYSYFENQNWVKYYYNNYGLFFSIKGSQNIDKIRVEIKEKDANLICVLNKEFNISENKQSFFISLRNCDIRFLSNIREICFTIFNRFLKNEGDCIFEVCDMCLKPLS